jgi:PqqD family protein of HPr-rel-A system
MTSPLWRALTPQALAWRQWDDELVLYNDATGSTHHLGAIGADVLLALLRHPSGIAMDTLVRDVAQRFELPGGDGALASEIERTLADLADIRLAACSPA